MIRIWYPRALFSDIGTGKHLPKILQAVQAEAICVYTLSKLTIGTLNRAAPDVGCLFILKRLAGSSTRTRISRFEALDGESIDELRWSYGSCSGHHQRRGALAIKADDRQKIFSWNKHVLNQTIY